MRTILVLIFISISILGYSQTDFISLDKQSYDYYLKGDYKNLKQTAKKQFELGMDYYYLRMRLGILAYNNQRYASAYMHFQKALTFNNSDTIIREYIYYSYLFAGRKADANIYLESTNYNQKNMHLKSLESGGFSNFYSGLNYTTNDATLYTSNPLTYEAIENSLSVYAGFETYFNSKTKLNLGYTNFRKTGTFYSSTNTTGEYRTFKQNQVYGKLGILTYPGFEFFGYGHIAFYTKESAQTTFGGRRSSAQIFTESTFGLGLTKNLWKLRFSGNSSFSKFGGSNQLRGEASITYLPFGNLNLYTTTSGMYQNDKNWGATYLFSQDIGVKAFKYLWIEAGVMSGNSFLYSRNQGATINNSFLIPALSVYGNAIVMLGNHFSITLTPSFSKNTLYSWDTTNYTQSNKVNSNSTGFSFTLTYKK